MGLYICIFDGADDVGGVDVGAYSDFNFLREYISQEIEGGVPGSLFPVFMLHSDSDGEWSVDECLLLKRELLEMRESMEGKPPVPFYSDWQRNVARSLALRPKNAFESFIDVDGEPLLGRLEQLVELALKKRLPLLFQ